MQLWGWVGKEGRNDGGLTEDRKVDYPVVLSECESRLPCAVGGWMAGCVYGGGNDARMCC